MARGVDYAIAGQCRRLEVLAAIRRLKCELDAMQTEVLAAIAADAQPYRNEPHESGKNWAREDVACALRVPSTTARSMLESAHEVATRFPVTLAAMWQADLTGDMADRLVDATLGLPDDAAREVEERVVARVGSQTRSQFAQSLRRAVAAADPRGTEEQHAAAREQRRVVFTAVEHGMTELFALLPADHAAQIRAAIEFVADTWKADDHDDPRTCDQRRADALHALAVHWTDGSGVENAEPSGARTSRPPSPRVVVNVTVPLSVLLGLDDRCGELDDHGPIPASVARRLAFGPNCVWRRLLVDPAGTIADVSAASYRPPAAMTRFVQLRDRTCQFPGCSRRATRCEIDHLQPWLRSKNTSVGNLICLCSRHHHLKHEAGWTIRRDSEFAVHWTDPGGLTYTRPPPEPPPF